MYFVFSNYTCTAVAKVDYRLSPVIAYLREGINTCHVCSWMTIPLDHGTCAQKSNMLGMGTCFKTSNLIM